MISCVYIDAHLIRNILITPPIKVIWHQSWLGLSLVNCQGKVYLKRGFAIFWHCKSIVVWWWVEDFFVSLSAHVIRVQVYLHVTLGRREWVRRWLWTPDLGCGASPGITGVIRPQERWTPTPGPEPGEGQTITGPDQSQTRGQGIYKSTVIIEWFIIQINHDDEIGLFIKWVF